ncbi:MAG TPA: DUF4956 domain-containing protein [Bacteroidia bacterium]|nr:DUF4956 domain-containing protein [Bacteroidia bacterium]HNT79989.1 DUF4956 domain-containing protein [Bacteroidia bacterium]
MILLQDIDMETAQNAVALFDKITVKLFQRLGVNLFSLIILVRFVYLPSYRNRENVFAYIVFNLIIFMITYLLNKVEMSMGAAFGLFAVFSMLRYRTENISIKDMTYLFLFIALGLINSISKGSWDDLAILNMILIVAVYMLESNWVMKKESSKAILYENIEMIKPENRAQLIQDLESRMGHKINHITIGKVDFLRDSAQIFVFYYE